ncbi:hypothetical protein [Streptomyces sp. MMS24-I29]|uniref:hypothetical protein n=1 Tax=Streptomyces sp. MMS24-I29 TaxID=3351480 RepID=UPI003C7D6C2E
MYLLTQFTRLRQHHVDGFIVATACRNHPLLRQVREQKTPLVLVNRTVERGGFTSVVADEAAGITAAVRHLIDLGPPRHRLPRGAHQLVDQPVAPEDLQADRRRAGCRAR